METVGRTVPCFAFVIVFVLAFYSTVLNLFSSWRRAKSDWMALK